LWRASSTTRPKLLTDLPPELAKLIEDVNVYNRGRLIPKLYSKAQAGKELRNMLNLNAKSEAADGQRGEAAMGELGSFESRYGRPIIIHCPSRSCAARGFMSGMRMAAAIST
jgi:hypothetical protein